MLGISGIKVPPLQVSVGRSSADDIVGRVSVVPPPITLAPVVGERLGLKTESESPIRGGPRLARDVDAPARGVSVHRFWAVRHALVPEGHSGLGEGPNSVHGSGSGFGRA